MHFVAFAIKRAYLRGLSVARPVAESVGLTPARFDLLYALYGRYDNARAQSELRRLLDVARPTVSRMVRRLEELGFVTRTRHYGDRRTLLVRFTAWGLRRFDRALRVVLGFAPLEWAYQCAFASDFGTRMPTQGTFFDLDTFCCDLRRLAKNFGNRSLLSFPTGHPDD
jgi:DNA-binding MarR family transcriptional regulator